MMIGTKKFGVAVVAVLAVASVLLTASAGNSSTKGKYKIGLLLPETKVARYEEKDRPYFQAKMKSICPSCTVLYANANSDAATQLQQAQSMLTQGAKVLVVDPYDGVAAAAIVEAAAAKKVPVVAYDRLIKSPKLKFVISNDYKQVGVLQATALVAKLKADGVKPGDGGIVMLNGASTDNNAGSIKAGALSVITPSGYKVLSDISTWDPVEAQNFTAAQITKFGTQIKAVYSANDGNIGGAIASFKAKGLAVPPNTGLDASLAGLQAIVAGDQYMTVYNAFQNEANAAATAAYALAVGKKPVSNAKVSGIPANLMAPAAVTKKNIMSTVIKDKFYAVADICTADYAKACAAAGIK